MAYGNNGYNNYGGGNNKPWKELDKNTKAYTLKNSQATFKSALVLGHWNSNITFKVHPALPESQRSTERVFDWNTHVMTVLTPENTSLLITTIYEEVLSNINDFEPVGVLTGNSFMEISRQSAFRGMADEGLFLNIYSKIDDQGTPKDVTSYKFNSRHYYKNFKSEGKQMEKLLSSLPTEFTLFVTFLKESLKAMTGAQAHAIRNANKYETQKSSNQLVRMAEKLGITQQDMGMNSSSNGESNYQASSFFNNNGGGQQSNQSNDSFDYSKEYAQLGGGDRMNLDD